MKADNPNADYNTLLDEGKIQFPLVYENAMTKLAGVYDLPFSLQEQLTAKRAFGLDKYGERAFQSTFENAMASPVGAHLGDEIVDAFNYALHGHYIAGINMNSQLQSAYEKTIHALLDVLSALKQVRGVLSNEEEREALRWTE